MAKKFSQLRERMSANAQKKAREKTARMLAEMALTELRQAREMSQEQLAATLQVKQASVSKLEKRTDMYVSTLRRFVEAMGGELRITAHFPDGDVRINQFADIGKSEPDDDVRARA